MRTTSTIRSPKQNRADLKGTASWYPYYAGFSEEFSREVISTSGLKRGGRALDVWNGSGTTTSVARSLGYDAVGVDLNPVMVITARARLLSPRERASLEPIARDILSKAASSDIESDPKDPLGLWLCQGSVTAIRRFEAAIEQLLIGCPISETEVVDTEGKAFSDLAAFYYLVLFRTVRKLLTSFIPSNPTWIRRPRTDSERIEPSHEELAHAFLEYARDMASALEEGQDCDSNLATKIILGDSTRLPLEDESIDLMLSSPPYCTRIDYAVATMPELAVLRFEPGSSLQELRRKLIGNATVPPKSENPRSEWGSACLNLLKQIEEHPSKASKTYYYKNHVQFFKSLYSSLEEIVRVLAPGAPCILVAQDSYYKDVHNDLPRIIEEMLVGLGMEREEKIDFPSRWLMANINSRARHYRSKTQAVESVLRLRKAQ